MSEKTIIKLDVSTDFYGIFGNGISGNGSNVQNFNIENLLSIINNESQFINSIMNTTEVK